VMALPQREVHLETTKPLQVVIAQGEHSSAVTTQGPEKNS
jgi:hypothetical protein